RNWTCISTQPSLRLSPPTLRTSRILVRYIFADFLAALAPLTFRLLFRTARFTIRIPQLASSRFGGGGTLRLSPQAAIDLVRGDEVAMFDPQPPAGLHHFVCRRRQWQRGSELAARHR